MQAHRFLLLIRHPEAEKNVSKSFGGSSTGNAITRRGLDQIEEISQAVRSWIRLVANQERVTIYSSDSPRLIACSEAVAYASGGVRRVDPRLTSINKGVISGVSELAVSQDMPAYYRKLRLYRMGLYNSYSIAHPGEGLKQFEERIEEAVCEIEKRHDEIAIVCAHKSTITAILLHYARRFHGYPKDFFGFSDVPLSGFSLISLAEPTEISLAGIAPDMFAASFLGWREEYAN